MHKLHHLLVMSENLGRAKVTEQGVNTNILIPTIFIDGTWIDVQGFEDTNQVTQLIVR